MVLKCKYSFTLFVYSLSDLVDDSNTLLSLAVYIAFNSPWQILTLPANTTIWSRRWNRIATVNNNTWSWTWTWSDLSCGHFTIRSFSCCDTILLEKCENSCQKCATVLQLNTTTVGPGHRRRTWTPSHLSCGHFTIGSFSCCDTTLLEKCENSCQKCAKVLQPNTTTGHEPDHIYLAVTLLSERWCGREEKISWILFMLWQNFAWKVWNFLPKMCKFFLQWRGVFDKMPKYVHCYKLKF